MSRIKSVNLEKIENSIAKTFNAQSEIWGSPLNPYLIYARRPALFRAVRGMWASLNSDKVLDVGLVSLINRRVASLNGCVF